MNYLYTPSYLSPFHHFLYFWNFYIRLPKYMGCPISNLFRYEGMKLEIRNFAHLLLIMYGGYVQEVISLWYISDLQMTLGSRFGEVQVVREREFPIFLNHVHCCPERWRHWNIHSNYACNQHTKPSLFHIFKVILRS